MDSVVSPERNIFLEQKLQAGEYIILVEPYFASNLVDTYNIGTYSDQLVDLHLLEVDEARSDYLEVLIWKDYFKKNKGNNKFKLTDQRRVRDGSKSAEFTCHSF